MYKPHRVWKKESVGNDRTGHSISHVTSLQIDLYRLSVSKGLISMSLEHESSFPYKIEQGDIDYTSPGVRFIPKTLSVTKRGTQLDLEERLNCLTHSISPGTT